MALMPKPFAVLKHLVQHQGHLVTQDELLDAVWPDSYVQPEVLRRYILEIRRVLGDRAQTPRFIETLPKRGYQFIAPVIDQSIAGHRSKAAAIILQIAASMEDIESLRLSFLAAQPVRRILDESRTTSS